MSKLCFSEQRENEIIKKKKTWVIGYNVISLVWVLNAR